MKSTGIIMQDFSIEGLRKQWKYQNELLRTKDIIGGEGITNFNYGMGCKTETRRLLKNPLPIGVRWWEVYDGELIYRMIDQKEVVTHCKCPYGVVGDELWVKEAYDRGFIGVDGKELFAYKADVDNPKWLLGHEEYKKRKWKSPLFMPKAASRIKLEITSIKVELLQDITEEGAMREGVRLDGMVSSGDLNYKMAYAIKWVEMHGEESWNKNPWVWVIGFTVKEFNL